MPRLSPNFCERWDSADFNRSAFGRGPFKPGFGLSGPVDECSYVTDIRSCNPIESPHAVGIKAFPSQRTKSFCYFLLLPSPRLLTTDTSCSTFESALERMRRNYKLQVYGYVVMSEHIHLLLREPQRDTLADALKSLKQGVARRLIGNLPLKPKSGPFDRLRASFEWRTRTFLAEALLRFQHSQLQAVCGEAALYSSQPGEAWAVRVSRGMEVEQFPPLCDRH